jgi:hypothetical protein
MCYEVLQKRSTGAGTSLAEFWRRSEIGALTVHRDKIADAIDDKPAVPLPHPRPRSQPRKANADRHCELDALETAITTKTAARDRCRAAFENGTMDEADADPRLRSYARTSTRSPSGETKSLTLTK